MANLFTRQLYRSEVARYNKRLVTLASRLGTDSPLYQNEVSKLNYWLDADNIRYNKQGIIQIAKPASLTDKMSLNQLKNLNVKKWQTIKEQYAESFKEAQEELPQGEKLSLSQYINNMSNIAENLGVLYGDFKDPDIQREVNKAIDTMHREHKNYDELLSVGGLIARLV